ncbi:hypothetical protein FHV99_004695 [Ochrobactrum sp. P20RRXII]|nr:hypothetical protein [Ochrobactrum sp. P20RRXII]NIH77443.1 hypothetical protein [Ochrobactrum sp. P20RRXII]
MADEVEIFYNDKIEVTTTGSNEVRVKLTEQGPLGPTGPMGSVTPELTALKNQAAASASAAAASEGKAKTSETNAKASETNAKASETAAASSKTAAKVSETNAANSQTAAAAAAAAAKTSETSSKTSETNSKASETAAKTSETNSKASETSAYSSASSAKTSETNARASQTAAANSQAAAKLSETNAKVSENAAAGSASAALASQNAAGTSETKAKASETAAKASEVAAKTSETNSKASEDSALSAKINASESAKAAKASEEASKLSEIAADNSQSEAAASAAAAKTSETAAKLSEVNAGASELNAKASETASGVSNLEAQNAKTDAEAAQQASELARDDAQEAKASARASLTQAEAARDAAQTAESNAEAAAVDATQSRVSAAASAEAAAASAAEASKFDPAVFPTKANNGSDFADPNLVRENIGAQIKLDTVTQVDAEAGTSTEERIWTPLRVKQAIAALAAAVVHRHNVSDIDGLQDILDGLLVNTVFTGVPTVPTPEAGDRSLQIANTEYVRLALDELVGAAPGTLDTLQEIAQALGDDPNFAATITQNLAGKSDIGHKHTVAEITDLSDALAPLAPKASPAFEGAPTAPTQDHADNSTKLATTAHVKEAIANSGLSTEGHKHAIADVTGLQDALDGKSDSGHKHEIADVNGLNAALNAKAPLASPALTGTPTAPTQAVGDNSTRLATTGFVKTAVENGVAGKADASHTHAVADVSGLQTALDGKAALASPTFSGAPKVPTAAAGTNTTQAASTAFVMAAIAGFSTTWEIKDVNGLQAALNSKLPLSGGSVNGTVSASLTHRDGGGYFNIGSYSTATYGSGYGRVWYNANGNAITFQSGSDSTARTALIAGAGDFSGTIIGRTSDAFRLQNGGNAVIQRKDGSTFYFLISDTETGSWNALRPFYFNLSSGRVTIGNGLTVNGGIASSSNISVGGAELQTNGNIVGSIWNNIGAGDAYTAIVNRIESRCQAWAVQESNRKARKGASWDQWNFTSHDQRAQNGTGENIYFTAKVSGGNAGVYLQISPDNNTFWTVGEPAYVPNVGYIPQYSAGCLPPGWWMRIIRTTGQYNANVILVW